MAAQASMTPAQMSQPMGDMTVQPQKKRGKMFAIAFAVIFVLLLGGGGAYGYFTYVAPSPKVAFARIIPQLTSSKTGHFKASIVVDFDKAILDQFGPALGADQIETEGVQISKDTSAQATLALDGVFDRTDASNTKSDITTTFKTTAVPFMLSIQTKFIDNTLYVKIPDLGFLTDLVGGNTGAFLPGDWVSLKKSDLESSDAVLPIQVASNITSDKQAQIAKLFAQGGVIVPTVELSKDKLNGLLMHRYQFSVDQKALKQALIQSAAIVSGTPLTDQEIQSLDPMLASVTITNGEIWVGMWDQKPHRVMFTIKPNGDLASAFKNVTVDITLDAFGLPVSITAPVSAKPFTALFDDARKKAEDAAVKSTITSIAPTAEIYYSEKHTYLGLCVAANGAKPLLDSIASRTGSTLYCKDSARFYAAAAPLSGESGVVCMDAGDKLVSLSSVPTGTVCK